ncbi:MAG TPA: [FeFe] hydrogenase H-cluster radical SAM maturase HydE [Lentisphaeria bacterium]|nr:MAG: [FeFe] hydrogenase H-cluster radical SAM maturase HydE [Lentisphaerae bacterium GWF2_38_69]HBM17579.1 [FeFe] hydrogenase H-cluster radical SAM maturase HydE [Lentisphaeria bacterium]
MNNIERLLDREFSRNDIVRLLSLTESEDVEKLRKKAFDLTTELLGSNVYFRGLIEFSNICNLNCYYCGIRKDNDNVERYMLSKKEIVDCAVWAAKVGYGSCVLQSGERRDGQFVSFVEACVREIKEKTRSDSMPDGLGITLSVGEQSSDVYKRFFEAGAHRYLLRIETSNQKLFSKLHPAGQDYGERKEAIKNLKKIGYQVGTGVMIGTPGQTIEDLADDILFFKENDIDMIGMGPYIVHPDSPMKEQGMKERRSLLQLSLNMIAVVRLFLKDVNIAATTALQALAPDGREQGILYGANIVMPNMTPKDARKNYQLYDGKPCINETKDECRGCLQKRIESTGRKVGYNLWGDSKHFKFN